jgi:ferredoxin
MATIITEDCINCGACEDECPNAAISMGEQMCALACPPEVCGQDPDRIETEDELLTRAKEIHPELCDSVTLDAATSHFRAQKAS